MTDRELLELAAKAAELQEHGWMGGSYAHVVDNTWASFDPLNDDGDAMRLAVKLRLPLCFSSRDEWGNKESATLCDKYWHSNDSQYYPHRELHNNDPYEATRRAIVRAAAEIGKGVQ